MGKHLGLGVDTLPFLLPYVDLTVASLYKLFQLAPLAAKSPALTVNVSQHLLNT